jgi:hypothetical protein
MIVAENAQNITFAATQKSSLLFTRTLVLRNTGRKEATNIEIALAVAPTVYRVWPPTETEDKRDATGHFFIKIKRLPPKSQLSVETLTENLQPVLAGISHDSATVHLRPVNIIPVLSRPTFIGGWLCLTVGAMVICYGVARLVIAGATAVGWI